MLMSLLQSFKKHSVSGVLLGSVVLLTACGGGGGGGGGGALPKKVTVVSPVKDGTVTDSSPDFELTFVDSVTDPSTLEVTLNTIDVTSLFSPDDAVDAESNANGVFNQTASVYSLSGILENGSENCITVKMAGSSSSGVCFTYDAKPGVVLSALTAGSSLDSYNIHGLTRKAIFDSVSINSLFATLSGGNQAFTLLNQDLPAPNAAASTSLDTNYVIVASDVAGSTADDQTVNIVVPKTTLKYGAAVQLNNSAFSVVADWAGDLIDSRLDAELQSYLSEPYPAPVDLAVEPDIAVAAFLEGSQACQLLNAIPDNPSYTDCKMYITAINPGTSIPEVKVLNSGVSDGKFNLEVKLTFATLDVTLTTAAWVGGNYEGGYIQPLTFNNATFTLKLDISKTGMHIAAFALNPAAPVVLNLDPSFPSVGMHTCTPALCGSATLPPTLVSAATSTIEGELRTQLGWDGIANSTFTSGSVLEELNIELADASIENALYFEYVKNAADQPVSVLNFAFTGSVVNEAKTTATTAPAGCDAVTKVCGGFIGIGGSTYADNQYPVGVIPESGWLPELPALVPALGSYFDPMVEATSLIGKNFFNATDDVNIALSENSLNQLLLSAFQSRLLDAQSMNLEVADLGEFGTLIVQKSAAFALLGYDIDLDDDVEITLGLEAIPNAEFKTGVAESGLQLNLYGVRVIVRLYRDVPGGAVDIAPYLIADVGDTYTVNMLLDVKALLNYGLNPLTALPFASIAPGNVALDVISLDSIQNMISEEVVQQAFPAFLGTYIENEVAELNQPIEQNVILNNIGFAEDKSAWLVLQALTVDAQNEFIVLTADVVDVEPAFPQQGIFRLNIADCVSNPTSVYCLMAP